MFVGKTRTFDTTATALAPDHSYAQQFAIPDARKVAMVAAALDGLGGSGGAALVKAVIYDSARNRVAVSEEITIPAAAAMKWRTFRFDAVELAAGNVLWALLAGGDAGVLRVYAQNTGTVPGKLAADTYGDGPASPFPALVTIAPIAMYADAFLAYAPAATDDEFYYGRLPLPEAQAKFGETGVIRGSSVITSASWHGTATDPERGSFAVVRAGSQFDDSLIGQRVKVSFETAGIKRFVYAFVHNVADLDTRDDISLTRRLWMELEAGSVDRIDATVELMA